MKKIFSFITNVSLLLILSISLCFSIGGGLFPAYAEGSLLIEGQTEGEGEDVEEILSTPFLINPTLLTQDDNNIYVYDSDDNSIKVIEKTTLTFRAENAVQEVNIHPSDILNVGETILLFDRESGDVLGLNIDDLSQVTLDSTLVEALRNSNKIIALSEGGTSYVLSCPSDPIISSFKLIKVAASEETSCEYISFSIAESFTNMHSFDNIYAKVVQDELFLVLMNENSVLSFKDQIDFSVDNKVLSTSNAVNSSVDNAQVREILPIEFGDNSSDKYVAIVFDTYIDVYNFSGTSPVELKKVEGGTISLEELQATSCSAKGAVLLALSQKNQKIKIFEFSKSEAGVTASQQEVVNPEIADERFENKELFEYYTLSQNSMLLQKPYSQLSIIEVDKQTHVVKIGVGKMGEEFVHGYELVMLTRADQNYYGYIKTENLQKLEETSFPERVSVLNNTSLLSLPSFIRDQNVVDLGLLKSTSKIEVLSGLSGYKGIGVSYYLVRVDDDKIGFIDASRAKVQDANKALVITNATVMRNNSEIFTEANSESDIITLLDKGARVKVIGKRDTKTNFTKVVFNDRAGNEHTGYIYTYNLEMDTWSMMQIIGIVLIIINTILLVVIICIKNKVTKS